MKGYGIKQDCACVHAQSQTVDKVHDKCRGFFSY